MKYPLIAAIFVFLLFMLLQSFVFEAIFVFLVTGAITGTSLTLPPGIMLVGFLALFIIFVRWVIQKQLYPGSPQVKAAQQQAHLEATQKRRKKRVQKAAATRQATPKRRYARSEA